MEGEQEGAEAVQMEMRMARPLRYARRQTFNVS